MICLSVLCDLVFFTQAKSASLRMSFRRKMTSWKKKRLHTTSALTFVAMFCFFVPPLLFVMIRLSSAGETLQKMLTFVLPSVACGIASILAYKYDCWQPRSKRNRIRGQSVKLDTRISKGVVCKKPTSVFVHPAQPASSYLEEVRCVSNALVEATLNAGERGLTILKDHGFHLHQYSANPIWSELVTLAVSSSRRVSVALAGNSRRVSIEATRVVPLTGIPVISHGAIDLCLQLKCLLARYPTSENVFEVAGARGLEWLQRPIRGQALDHATRTWTDRNSTAADSSLRSSYGIWVSPYFLPLLFLGTIFFLAVGVQSKSPSLLVAAFIFGTSTVLLWKGFRKETRYLWGLWAGLNMVFYTYLIVMHLKDDNEGLSAKRGSQNCNMWLRSLLCSLPKSIRNTMPKQKVHRVTFYH